MEDTILINSNIYENYKTPHNITFHNEENKEVGRLEFGGKGMFFTGNADESAKIFFEYLETMFGNYIKELIKEDYK
jgi:hypothetical protein